MREKDISWVQLDVTAKNIEKLKNIDLEVFFYNEEVRPTQTLIPETVNDTVLLNAIMNSLGYQLVRVESIIGRERLLYAWTGEHWYPIKHAYHVASVLTRQAGINMRGLLHSGNTWLHMLEASEAGKKFITPTLSLQETAYNDVPVMHDIEDKNILIRIDNNLDENDRDALVVHNKGFVKFFQTIDYALAVLRYE